MAPKKPTTFHILQSTSYKNPFCCNPPLDQKLVFLKETLMLNTKQNEKSEKPKIRQRDLKDKAKQETKTQKGLKKNNFAT